MSTESAAAQDCTGPPPPSREQLLYLLHEAAEVEHNLMCCYLYAAFSLKRSDPAWTPEQAAAVERWRATLRGVALEEMSHLVLVGNLMSAIGALPNFNRPPFPIESGPYPSEFVIRLQPFALDTIEHFQFVERPHDARIEDGPGFVPERRYRRTTSLRRLSPGGRDYATVGDLYATIRRGFEEHVAAYGEPALFVGHPGRQVDARLAPLPGVQAVRNAAEAQAALGTIVFQGEGADHPNSHFLRFTRVHSELVAHLRADPMFEPAWPCATNPVMNPPPNPDDKVHVDHPVVSRWLDLGNALYVTSLRCLQQGFHETSAPRKAVWLTISFGLMRALVPLGEALAAQPARARGGEPHAGLTFTPLRTLALLPEPGAAQVVDTRLGEIVVRARGLPGELMSPDAASAWSQVIAGIERQRERLSVLAERSFVSHAGGGVVPEDLPSSTTRTVAALAPAAQPASIRAAGPESSAAPAPAAVPEAAMAAGAATPPGAAGDAIAPAPKIERVRGRAITIVFDGSRCIHSRHCVLEAPGVFLANTPGAWIRPDEMRVDALVAVAEKCPSGAIRYERHDGGPAEQPPPVNALRVRENGPLALHGALDIAGEPATRATLCRCGQSRNKPYCDGSHAAAGFAATGEPPTGDTTPLAQRGGVLRVEPLANGPLEVAGNLELCAGTGRVFARVGAPNPPEVRLCRCGQSKNKPFCDGSHLAAGFTAPGR